MSEEIESVECNELISRLVGVAYDLYAFTDATNTLRLGVKTDMDKPLIGFIQIDFDIRHLRDVTTKELIIILDHKDN